MSMFGHIIADFRTNKMEFWVRDDAGQAMLKHVIPCSNATIAPGYGHDGHCPPGDYELGDPQPRTAEDGAYYAAEGDYFTPLVDVDGLWRPQGRDGIGVHGGGTAAPDPHAAHQTLEPTEGCTRLYNIDNDTIFVPFVRYVKARGTLKFTVLQPEET